MPRQPGMQPLGPACMAAGSAGKPICNISSATAHAPRPGWPRSSSWLEHRKPGERAGWGGQQARGAGRWARSGGRRARGAGQRVCQGIRSNPPQRSAPQPWKAPLPETVKINITSSPAGTGQQAAGGSNWAMGVDGAAPFPCCTKQRLRSRAAPACWSAHAGAATHCMPAPKHETMGHASAPVPNVAFSRSRQP